MRGYSAPQGPIIGQIGPQGARMGVYISKKWDEDPGGRAQMRGQEAGIGRNECENDE